MSLFSLVPQSLKGKLNPHDEPNMYLGASADNSAEYLAWVQDTIEEQEEYVLSRLPIQYQALLTHVAGEWLIGRGRTGAGAFGNETTVQLSLFPASNVALFLNYTTVWDNRTYDDAVDPAKYSLNASTGLITFQDGFTLSRGDRLIATYDHTGLTNCRLLMKMVKDMAATEVARCLYAQTRTFDIYQEWANQVYSDLKRMHLKDEGKLTIKTLEQIELVRETTENRPLAGAFTPGADLL